MLSSALCIAAIMNSPGIALSISETVWLIYEQFGGILNFTSSALPPPKRVTS